MFTWPIHIGMANWFVLVLKGDIMVRHHMGPNRMHPDRSSCLGLSANGWMSQDQVFCTFSEQMLRSVYSTILTLEYLLRERLNQSHKIQLLKWEVLEQLKRSTSLQTWNLSWTHGHCPCKIWPAWGKIDLWTHAICCKFSSCCYFEVFFFVFAGSIKKWME